MIRVSYLLLLAVAVLSGCGGTHYAQAPLQHLPAIEGPKTAVTVLNNSGGNVEFFKGPLQGLILAPWQWYRTELPLGFQVHRWSQEVLHKESIKHYSDQIIVTHMSRTLRIIPPARDNVYYTRGKGSLSLKDY